MIDRLNSFCQTKLLMLFDSECPFSLTYEEPVWLHVVIQDKWGRDRFRL